MHHFVGALSDDETGILRIEYVLEDLTTHEVLHLERYTHPGLPRDQNGEKTDSVTIRNLTLSHNHTYRVNATAFNGVSVPLAQPCATSTVLVDTTPPVTGPVYIVFSDEEGLKPEPYATSFQYSTKVLRIAARNFSDPESGLTTFWVRVDRTDGIVIQEYTWINLREFITLDVQLRHGQSFRATWRADNHAELTSEVRSHM